MEKLGPKAQIEAALNEDLAFFSQKAPTMEEMKFIYGKNFPAIWLMDQILDLVVYSNSRGVLNDYQAKFLAQAIANEKPKLKASELLLFFYRIKAGRYGHFFGVVDPMRITIALEEFCEERNRYIAQRLAGEDAQNSEPSLPPVKPEEWCKSIGFPECHGVLEVLEIFNRFENSLRVILWFIEIMSNVFIRLITNTKNK